MWYQVKELKETKRLNTSQISKRTGLARKTVRRYLKMSEEEFHGWIGKSKNLPKKLSDYMPFVKKELEACSELSAAQIEDHLKENFPELPKIHSKTVYNFVQLVREKYDIPKPKKKGNRDFEKLPELPYGKQAQVDFGETYLLKANGKRKKVHFFCMVLSRSRYKFVYMSDKPFTAKLAVYAHELAFEYFAGIPKEIVYDQDSVFIKNENLGDYLLSKEFHSYCNTQSFRPVFCRKADPQSKGKIENVVKYIKYNFLRGRKYVNNEILNEEAIAWLKRTGNKKKHSTTQKIPIKEWKIEKNYLQPLKQRLSKEEKLLISYKVRKDNTIAYKGNFYSLPLGTYKNRETKILLEQKDGKLYLYSVEEELITIHNVGIDKGKLIKNTDHKREKSKTIEEKENQVIEILGETDITKLFLKSLKKEKPRYYRDNLQYIITNVEDYSFDILQESLLFCIENKQFNSSILLQAARTKNTENQKQKEAEATLKSIAITSKTVKKEYETDTSNIDNYENIINTWSN